MGTERTERAAAAARDPVAWSREVLPGLGWTAWADLAADPKAPPLVRRRAEGLLLARLPDLGLGERIALARRATRRVIPGFDAETEPRALAALLDNPRLVEEDVTRLAATTAAGPQALAGIAAHARWGTRRRVRFALLRRSGMPVPDALNLARRLDPADLRVLVEDDRVPVVVRVGIERRLSGTSRADGETNDNGERS